MGRIRANLARIYSIDGHPVTHFLESRARSQTEMVGKRTRLRALDVPEIRRQHRQPALTVSRVDDEAHCLIHPLGFLLSAEVIENEQIGFEHRPQDVEFRHFRRTVVGVSNKFEQLTNLIKDGARALPHDRVLHQRHGKVGLADAGITVEQEAAVNHWKLLDESSGLAVSGTLRVRVYFEVTELAVRVAARDAGVLQQRLRELLVPALASGHSRDTIDRDRLPTSVFADGTGHASW